MALFKSFFYVAVKSAIPVLFCILLLSALSLADPGGNFTGTESNITIGGCGTDQTDPSVWEDTIVWADYREYNDEAGDFQSDIYLYNLLTGEERRISDSPNNDRNPDIWDDLIVWRTYDPVDGDYEVYLYNITSNVTVQITNDLIHQGPPRIWDHIIVWQEGDESFDAEIGICLYDILTGEMEIISSNSSYALSPDIWHDRVVWQDGRNGVDFDIYLFNITTGLETQVTTDPAFQILPSIWGDLIVWEDYRTPSAQIWLYNLTSGTETRMTNGEESRENPVISGNYIVYVNQTDYFDIYLIDLPAMQDGEVSNDLTGSAQMNPDIWGDRIVWTDGRNGDFDIFLFTLGSSLPTLSADFDHNASQGNPPLNVAFTDRSSGQVDGWHWDFGDGNYSTDQNPVHTYITEGSYSVILNIHNQRQRDKEEKKDLISVGSEPVPQFSMNCTSGPAPLSVKFTDSSAGTPTDWLWDFGDGNISNEQNPAHVYGVPGIYEITLNVRNKVGNASITDGDCITVMEGTYHTCRFPSEGIIIGNGNTGPVLIDITKAVNCSFSLMENNSVLECVPGQEYGIDRVWFHSGDEQGFLLVGNDTITGNITGVSLASGDIALQNFDQKAGVNCSFNFISDMQNYPSNAIIQVVAWEGCTPDDFSEFDNIKTLYDYVAIDDLAYTIRFSEENITENSSAVLFFGVSSDWVDQYGWRWCNLIESDPPGAAVFVDSQYIGDTPICIEEGLSPGNHTVTVKEVGYYDKTFPITIDDKRDSIHVIRIGDDGTGEVLNTIFIGHDPERNLDFFRAESPKGLSTFGLASLSKSGNIPQLVNLVISGIVSGGGGGGGGSSASASLGSAQETAAPTQVVPEPAETLSPLQEEPPAPEITSQPVDTAPAQEPASAATSEAQGISPIGSLVEGTSSLIILRNLSVVFVVIFVAAVFYLRWKR